METIKKGNTVILVRRFPTTIFCVFTPIHQIAWGAKRCVRFIKDGYVGVVVQRTLIKWPISCVELAN